MATIQTIQEENKKNIVQYGKPLDEKEEVFYLPHSCDEWIIGNIKEAEKFLEDLRKKIEEIKRSFK